MQALGTMILAVQVPLPFKSVIRDQQVEGLRLWLCFGLMACHDARRFLGIGGCQGNPTVPDVYTTLTALTYVTIMI